MEIDQDTRREIERNHTKQIFMVIAAMIFLGLVNIALFGV